MAIATTGTLTLEEFERVEFGPDDVELLKGEVIRMPPPVRQHMERRERTYLHLLPQVDRCRAENPHFDIGTVHIEMGYAMRGEPHSWLRPGISITHRHQKRDRYYAGAPLMVFEIVSHSDTAKDLDARTAEYLENGAEEVWLLYPHERHAWIYRPRIPIARLEAESIRSDLLPGVVVPFSQLL